MNVLEFYFKKFHVKDIFLDFWFFSETNSENDIFGDYLSTAIL